METCSPQAGQNVRNLNTRPLGSVEITTHGFCGQICFDNTGGCDTIEQKPTGVACAVSYYSPLYGKMQSGRCRGKGTEHETGKTNRRDDAVSAGPAGPARRCRNGKRRAQHHGPDHHEGVRNNPGIKNSGFYTYSQDKDCPPGQALWEMTTVEGYTNEYVAEGCAKG